MVEPTAETKLIANEIKKIFEEGLDMFIARNNYWKSRFLAKGFDACISNLEDKIFDVKQGGKPPKEDAYECLLDVMAYAAMAAYLEKQNKGGNVEHPDLS